MQNRYVADVGDYGKYGLLRFISKTNLALGVNWYLAPDENHNSNGKHTSYLTNRSDRAFDEKLYITLKNIIQSDNRNVHSVQDSKILGNTAFYNKVLDLSSENDFRIRQELRSSWHKSALEALQNCEVVFLDPDIGLEIKSVSLTSVNGNKYIGIGELKDYCSHGKSVIFYNHRERKPQEEYLDRFRELKKDSAFKGCSWFGLKFVRGTIRDYIFIIRPEHLSEIKTQLDAFLSTNWSSVFSKLVI